MTATTTDPIAIERHGSVAVVHLRAGKANALTRPLLDAIVRAIDTIEASDAAAIVITGEGSAFSAGLALPELIDLDRAAMSAHIDRFGAVMQRVLACPRPTVAAINGHAIAGGAVLALMCDERVMVSAGGRIGLTEIRLGIGLPAIVVEPARLRLAGPAFLRVALDGELVGGVRAVELGLATEHAAPDAVVATAIARAAELGRAPAAYAQIKQAILRPVLAAIAAHAAADRESWLDTWFSPHGQDTLRAAVARIGRPSPDRGRM
jgi:enoyl-CoA hydratase